MTSIVIRNADYVVTVNERREIICDGAVYIEGNQIVSVGPTSQVSNKHPNAEEVIDARGKAVYPGLVNTHNHLFEVLLKGLADDRVLIDWLKTSILPSAQKLSSRHVYPAAILGVIEAIKSGTTTILEFGLPGFELSQAVLKAFQDSGIRGIVAPGVIDAGEDVGLPPEIIQDSNSSFKEIRQLHEKFAKTPSPRLHVWLAPIAIWGVTKASLIGSREIANELNTGITMHIAETPFESQYCKSKFGCEEMELYRDLGFLGPDLLAVHCVYLNDSDLRIVKTKGVKISHNPISNMYVSAGVAPIPRMFEMGIIVGLGTDGAASNGNQDMVQLMKTTALLHKVVHAGDPTVITAGKVLEMATIKGAEALGLENEIGSIEKGKRADVFTLNLGRTFVAPVHNPVSALVYGASSESIEETIVDGQILMKNRSLRVIDEQRAIKASNEAAENLVNEAGISQLRDIWVTH